MASHREHPIHALFSKYLADQCDAREMDELLNYFNLHADSPELRRLVDEAMQNTVFTDAQEKEINRVIDRNEATILALPHGEGRHGTAFVFRRWLPYIAAASVLALLTVGYLFFIRPDDGYRPVATSEIAPGGNRAVLTLADGRTIDLSEEQGGIIIGDGITYVDGSEISDGSQQATASLMSLATPKGGTYQITLPDGSVVWLNSASTLKYPSQFDDNERVVELEGEAYFEVTKTERPFRVATAGQTVEVLGTEFNISAYADEPETKTTLVEGKVNVSVGSHPGLTTNDSRLMTKVLTPGEQATTREAAIDVQKVDVAQYTAWRSGLFAFSGASVGDVMKQLERWYDIDVVYEGEIPAGTFDGKIGRNLTLQQLLRGLAQTRIQYTIEGRTLTIIGEK